MVIVADFDATAFSSPASDRRDSRATRLTVAVAAALALVCGLQAGDVKLLLAIGGVGGLLAVFYCLPYVMQHRDWLVCPLILIFLINGVSFFTPAARAGFHYGMLALFCLPVAASALRSDIFRSGGFRLYTIYFLWAAATIIYSLAPEYSLARLGEGFLILLALTAIALDVRDADDVMRLLAHFLVGGGVVLALVAASAVVLPHSLTWLSPLESFTLEEIRQAQKLGLTVYGVDRFRGLLGGPNDIGELMLILVGPAMVCWRTAARGRRALLAALIIVAVSLAALADSRSPFVALTVGGMLYSAWRWRARGIALLATAATAGVLIAYIHGGLGAYVARGNVSTLTGRTEIWAFAVREIERRPILGYGYEVSGAIFESRYFPIWWGPWDLGPHSSLHDGYLDHAVGVGVPATLLWLYIILRPWVFVLRQPDDPWNLKPIFLLIVIPILVNNLTEELLGDFIGSVGVLFGLTWVLAERYRLFVLQRAKAERAEALAKLPGGRMALAEVRGSLAIAAAVANRM